MNKYLKFAIGGAAGYFVANYAGYKKNAFWAAAVVIVVMYMYDRKQNPSATTKAGATGATAQAATNQKEIIKAIQSNLNILGESLTVDGVDGPKTTAAINRAYAPPRVRPSGYAAILNELQNRIKVSGGNPKPLWSQTRFEEIIKPLEFVNPYQPVKPY